MATNRWNPEIHDAQLRRLHAGGMGDNELAITMGFARSVVATYRDKLGLPANLQAPRLVKEAAVVPAEERIDPYTAAINALGDRLKERNGAYWVDGRHHTFDEVMQQTNKVRDAKGEKQILYKPIWRAK